MQITIDRNYENSRLDRFLREYFNAPQGIIAGIIRKGKVKIDGKKMEISSRLSVGDVVTVYHKFEDVTNENFAIHPDDLAEFTSWIIFENENFLAINKPCGISSQGGVRARLSVDVLAKGYTPEARITHRLDRETSGIMIIAKNKNWAREITGLFADGLVKKQYLAIATLNENVKKHGTIVTDIEKDIYAQKMVCFDGEGAVTEYRVTQAGSQFAKIDVFPQTGKTHQIRVHLSSIGMPIVGDEKYGGVSFKRMMLHACSIKFNDFIITCEAGEEFTNFELA